MAIALALDAGDVYLQSETPIGPHDTAQTIHDRLARLGANLLRPTLEGLDQGILKGQPQDESQVTHAHKLTKDMEWLDATGRADDLDRQVRSLNPWPGTSLQLENGRRLKVRVAKLRKDLKGECATLFERSGMVCLGTSAGSLELLEIQWEGKRVVDSAGFLNGLKGRGESLPLKVFPPPAL